MGKKLQDIFHLNLSSFWVSPLHKSGSFLCPCFLNLALFVCPRILGLAFVVPGSRDTQKELDLERGNIQKEPDLGSEDTQKELDFKKQCDFFYLFSNKCCLKTTQKFMKIYV